MQNALKQICEPNAPQGFWFRRIFLLIDTHDMTPRVSLMKNKIKIDTKQFSSFRLKTCYPIPDFVFIYTNIKRSKWADPNHLVRQIILSSGSNHSNVEHQTRLTL